MCFTVSCLMQNNQIKLNKLKQIATTSSPYYIDTRQFKNSVERSWKKHHISDCFNSKKSCKCHREINTLECWKSIVIPGISDSKVIQMNYPNLACCDRFIRAEIKVMKESWLDNYTKSFMYVLSESLKKGQGNKDFEAITENIKVNILCQRLQKTESKIFYCLHLYHYNDCSKSV